MYSNGLSEVCLGKAIKELDLPREEIVVMTKVCERSASTTRYRHANIVLEGIRRCR